MSEPQEPSDPGPRGTPPDGYLGHRDPNEPEGTDWGPGSCLAVILITLGLVMLVLYLCGQFLKSKGI